MKIYRQSVVAFVGGSLAPYGGQNSSSLFLSVRPSSSGLCRQLPRRGRDHRRSGAGVMVEDEKGLLSTMTRVLEDPDMRQGLVEAGKKVLSIQKGAMEETAVRILETIWKNSQSS